MDSGSRSEEAATTTDNEITPEIIADWQRHCREDPVGEITLDCIDVAELLRVYQAWQEGLPLEVSRGRARHK